MEPITQITPAWMSSNQPVVDALWAGNNLIWLEKRSDRTALMRKDPDQPAVELPVEHTIRGGLFYGGGELACCPNFVVYTEKSGQLYRLGFDSKPPTQLTRHEGKAAAPVLSKDENLLVYIHSDGVTDSLCLLNLCKQDTDPVILTDEADFFMQPAIHPDGGRLAWVEWNHPQMPWQGSRLMTARREDDHLVDVCCLAGDENIPVFQPVFSPDGRWLSFITTPDEWDRLVLVDLKDWSHHILLSGLTLMEPAWVQGLRTYGWLPDSSGILQLSNEQGITHLQRKQVDGSSTPIDLFPYTSCSQISISADGQSISLLASSAQHTPRLILLHEGQIDPIRYAYAQRPEPGILPTALPVHWPSENGEVHGIYYSPTGSDQPSELPPAIIHIHSGPTRQVDSGFSAEAAFFTSRGFAVLSINYHGSTGYGRSYCDALNGRWGDLDVADARSGAAFLLDSGLADPDRLVIKGSSAGGYTVLNTLIRYPGVFKAGICAYGVSNLLSIIDETFKYEARYYDSLIGPLPQDRQKYIDWSPVNHADRIRDPLAIFQGSEDVVVPPSQAEQIVQALQQNGTPYHYHLFDGEGHGWRKSETLAAYYAEMEQFLQKYLAR